MWNYTRVHRMRRLHANGGENHDPTETPHARCRGPVVLMLSQVLYRWSHGALQATQLLSHGTLAVTRGYRWRDAQDGGAGLLEFQCAGHDDGKEGTLAWRDPMPRSFRTSC